MVLPYFLFLVFALCERKNEKRLENKVPLDQQKVPGDRRIGWFRI
jgi:hypothetical protein